MKIMIFSESKLTWSAFSCSCHARNAATMLVLRAFRVRSWASAMKLSTVSPFTFSRTCSKSNEMEHANLWYLWCRYFLKPMFESINTLKPKRSVQHNRPRLNGGPFPSMTGPQGRRGFAPIQTPPLPSIPSSNHCQGALAGKYHTK